MQVKVLYFGVLKDIFRAESDVAELPVGATVGSLLQSFRERAPGKGGLWGSLAVAVNHEYASAECELKDGDEVALMPPVSGGSAGGSAAGGRTARSFAALRMTAFGVQDAG